MIRILPVPPNMLAQAFTVFGNQLLIGLVKAGEGIKATADLLNAGSAAMWAIFENDRPLAAFVTRGGNDDEGNYLFVYGLGGRGVLRFARHLERALIRHARENGLSRIKFYGKKAWARLIPICKVVGEQDGHALYEWRSIYSDAERRLIP